VVLCGLFHLPVLIHATVRIKLFLISAIDYRIEVCRTGKQIRGAGTTSFKHVGLRPWIGVYCFCKYVVYQCLFTTSW
jgi:hypothetical protein